jgi:hypothetical protein
MNVNPCHFIIFAALSENAVYRMKIKKFLYYYYKSVIVFLLIFFVSIIPGEKVQEVSWLNIPNFDKLIHLGMYFCFSFILIFDIIKTKPQLSKQKIYIFTTTIAVLYSGLLEIVQATLTNSRSGDIIDFFFNISGILISVLAWSILGKFK